MHPLPADFAAAWLLGRRVEGVWFAPMHVSIHFSDEATLQIEGGFELRRGEHRDRVDGFPLASSDLPRLIGDEVSNVAFDLPSGDLALEFARGQTLSIAGDQGPYEVWHLYLDGREIIV